MNVVVSAIVDPWVTTLSFVVALAMRIQGNNQVRKVSFPSKGAIILSRPNQPLIQECIVLH